MAVPFGAAGEGVRGVVLLVRQAGKAVFSAKETEPLQGFAAQAALAMELAERRRDAEQIAVLQIGTGSPGTCTTWRSSGCSPPG